MNNAKKVSIVDYADVLKTSLENRNSVIVGYKPSNDGYFGVSQDIYVDANNSINFNDIKLVDSTGQPIVIDSLKYYTVGNDNRLISLTSEEVEELLLNNTKSPILMSSNELSGDVVASDLGLVTESMDNLVGYINADGKLEYSAEVGESGLFGAMFDVINYYRNINNSLKAGIVGEANAVAAIAQAYQAIDTAGASVANNALNTPYYGGYSGGGSSKSNISENEYTVNGMTAEQINASTTSMMSNTKSAVSSGRYDKIANFLGDTAQPGKIGKVSVSKLGDTINTIIPTLEEDAKSSTQMMGSIDDFISQINSNGKLKGEAWDKVKKNLSSYKDLLEVSVDSSEFLANVMETAKKMIEDFLYPDTELDDSVLPELEEQFTKLKNSIADLDIKIQQMRNSQREVCSWIVDKSGKQVTDYSTCHKDPTDEEIARMQSLLDQYKAEAEEIEKKIKRIYDFADVMKNAQKLIKDAVEEVKKAFENPSQHVGDNSGFASRFNLDLSAYGLVGSSAGDYLKGYMDQVGSGENNTQVPKTINGADLLSIGNTQKGNKYHSMHYGPKELGGGGFGCAMFVAYCYNEMLHPGESINGGDENTKGFYGGCSHFYGNITTDNFDYHNKGFVEVSEADRQAGDVVCFVTTRESDDIRGSARNCFHVGIYTGDGNKIMHSTGMGITNNGAGGVGVSTIGEYKRAKISSLEHQHSNGTLSDYNRLTYNGVQDSGIQVIYLRYVGENNEGGELVQV